MHDVTLTHVTLGSLPHAQMCLFMHAHAATLHSGGRAVKKYVKQPSRGKVFPPVGCKKKGLVLSFKNSHMLFSQPGQSVVNICQQAQISSKWNRTRNLNLWFDTNVQPAAVHRRALFLSVFFFLMYMRKIFIVLYCQPSTKCAIPQWPEKLFCLCRSSLQYSNGSVFIVTCLLPVHSFLWYN